jgi:hypothetical protein
MNLNVFAGALALAVVAAGPVGAETIFENFPSSFNNSGAIANDAFGREVFVNFRPDADVRVRSIRWLGDFSAAADNFRVSFTENPDLFSSPDTSALFLKTSTADSIDPKPFDFGGPAPVFLEAIYGENLGVGIDLVGGRNYQISVSAIATSFYAWKTASLSCCSISRKIDTGEDTLISIVPGFGLYGTSLTDAAVPEPMTWALMIAGFGVVGAQLRRREPARAV